MLMEAPTYWVMVLARVIQGVSSSIIWVVGLALLCVPAARIRAHFSRRHGILGVTPLQSPSLEVSRPGIHVCRLLLISSRTAWNSYDGSFAWVSSLYEVISV